MKEYFGLRDKWNEIKNGKEYVLDIDKIVGKNMK